jgi:hypothetical protein
MNWIYIIIKYFVNHNTFLMCTQVDGSYWWRRTVVYGVLNILSF